MIRVLFILSHTAYYVDTPTYRPVWSDAVRAGGASHGLIDALVSLRSLTHDIMGKCIVSREVQSWYPNLYTMLLSESHHTLFKCDHFNYMRSHRPNYPNN